MPVKAKRNDSVAFVKTSPYHLSAELCLGNTEHEIIDLDHE